MKIRILLPSVMISALAGFILGVFATKLNWAPVQQMSASVRSWTSTSDIGRLANSSEDMSKIMSFDTRKAAIVRRDALKNAISMQELIPELRPAVGLRYARHDLVMGHQLLRFTMRHGLTSNIHFLRPANYNRQIFMLHGGHDAYPEDLEAEGLITALLEKGYGVALFSMPLSGYNRQTLSVATDRFGRIDLVDHNALSFLEEPDFSPIGYFVDPVLSFVRYAQEQNTGDEFAMGGHSGGGWTTVIAAALETRIRKSYVIAGTSPEFLTPHVTQSGWGDYEQTNMRMLRAANYMEMYLLTALERDRRQVHLFARKDPCCWNGPNLGIYETPILRRLRKLGGGSLTVAIDEYSAVHNYTRFAKEHILMDLMRP